MSQLKIAIDQIVFARNYTFELVDSIALEDWFRKPTGGISHIAWQVGHLAVAEYRIALMRIRGALPEDTNLVSQDFVRMFGYDSTPQFDAGKYPTQTEIRAVLDRVHEQALRELNAFDDVAMDQEVLNPHPRAKTKLQALYWCAHHEMLHAGQIGLLRRELGFAPT
jgi:uncharacterized damage-inducible protein DinB